MDSEQKPEQGTLEPINEGNNTPKTKKASEYLKQNFGKIVLVIIIAGLVVGSLYISSKRNQQNSNQNSNTQEAQVTTQNQNNSTDAQSGQSNTSNTVKGTQEQVDGKTTYKETAAVGQGITHLARTALNDYLVQNNKTNTLTPEDKIYIEDYLQNKTGNEFLKIGEEKTFSQDLIEEAIASSQQLSDQQLENLKQYSARVSFS